VLVVAAGVGAQLVRPLAPDLGPPPDAGRFFDAAYLRLVESYRRPIYAALLAALLVRIAVAALVALTPVGRRLTARVVATVGAARPARAAAAVVVGVVALTDVVLLPLAFWLGYVHEGRYGFRTQGLGGWARDWLVTAVPAWLAVGVLALAGYALARRLPRAWPAVAGLAAGAASVVVVFAAPLVLEPLQFRLTPLPAGPVRGAVEAVLDRAGVDVDALLVADASRRSTKQNAYVSGLGATRRVVLYDTLLAERAPDEVGVVLAHELGHRVHGDLARTALLGAAGSVAAGAVLAAVVRRRAARGRQDGQVDPRAAAVVVLVALLLNTAALPVQAFVSRRAEAAADLAALRFTRDPQTYLELTANLARANLGDPAPPGWAYVLWFSHPTTTARLELGVRWPQLP
jgi:STE24 endopeptidase